MFFKKGFFSKKTEPDKPKKLKKTTADGMRNSFGAGSETDRGAGYIPSIPFKAPMMWGEGIFFAYYTLFRFFWEARKLVTIPPSDMTREGWNYVGQEVKPELLKQIKQEETRLSLITTVNEALEYERLYGAGVILIGTAEQESQRTAEQPLNVKALGQGDLTFVRAFPRPLVVPFQTNINPLSVNYRKAEIYHLSGVPVHVSRLLIFDGGGHRGPRTSSFASMGGYARTALYDRDGFGESALEPVFEDIVRACGSRGAAFHLIHLLSIMLFKVDETNSGLNYTKGTDRKLDTLENISKAISIYQGAILEKGMSVEQYTANIRGIPEIIEKQLQVLAAAADVPAARFLGDSPGGLNATGKGELVNYYDMIKSKQVLHLKPQLEKLKTILLKSAVGDAASPEQVDIDFNPLMQLAETDKMLVREKDWLNIISAYEKGLVTKEWVAKEARERGIFYNEMEFQE